MIRKDRDTKILSFIEQNKGISISQCAKIFYTHHKFAYDEARKRLKILEKSSYITHYIFPNTKEFIYCFDNNKQMSYHSLIILNFYADLMWLSTDVLFYQFELKFSTGKKCDAYFEIKFNNKIIPLILEVDFTHNTSITKYEEIYNTKELQQSYVERFGEEYEDIFPLVIIISFSKIRKYNGFIKYKLIPFNLSNLNETLNTALDIQNNCIELYAN